MAFTAAPDIEEHVYFSYPISLYPLPLPNTNFPDLATHRKYFAKAPVDKVASAPDNQGQGNEVIQELVDQPGDDEEPAVPRAPVVFATASFVNVLILHRDNHLGTK